MRRGALILAFIGVLALVALGAACSDPSGPESGRAGALSLEDVLERVEHPHDIAIDPSDPQVIWLGLHGGLYRSDDGGRGWELSALEGEDAMNVSGGGDQPLWVAGHNVLSRSEDRGGTFSPVRPRGLPNLDLHGFTVRDERPRELVAAAAGEGLYRSRDGGESFTLLTRAIGAGVFGLSAGAGGKILAADPQRGVFVSSDGSSRFRQILGQPGILSVAAHPLEPRVVMVAGEPGVLVSRDGGESFRSAFAEIPVSALALDPADRARAVALGADGVLYETGDGGRTWGAVE